MRKHIADILIVLTLFGAYAVGAMLLSAIGADVYTDEAENIQNNYDMRTGALYIAEKVRQNDVNNSIRLSSTGDGDALVLKENKSGKGYETWIYVYEGSLREILTPPESEFKLTDGQVIMPMERIEFNYEAKLLNIRLISAAGEISEMKLISRSPQEVV